MRYLILFLLVSCGQATPIEDCTVDFPGIKSTHVSCQLINSCQPGDLCTCKSQVVVNGCEIRCEVSQ